MGTFFRMTYRAASAGVGSLYVGDEGLIGLDDLGNVLRGYLQVSDRARGKAFLEIRDDCELVTGVDVTAGQTIAVEMDWPSDYHSGQSLTVVLGGQCVELTLEALTPIPIPPGLSKFDPKNSMYIPLITG